jgi:thiol:disulfide interchange protein DsbD
LLKRWLTVLALAVGLPALGLGAPAFAQAGGMENHARVTLVSERAAVVPGDQFLAALKLEIDEGWHVYWRNPGDSGEAPSMRWTLPEGVTAGEFQFPTPEFELISAEIGNYVYKHEVTLPLQVNVPATQAAGAPVAMSAKVLLLICSDICIPERYDVTLTLPVEAAPRPDAAGSQAIQTAIERSPKNSTGSAASQRNGQVFRLAIADSEIAAAAAAGKTLRFYPAENDGSVSNSKPQVITRGPNGVTFELQSTDLAPAGDVQLAGVVATDGPEGQRQAWNVTAPPGAAPAGVSGTAVTAGGGSGEAIGLVQLLGLLGAAFLGGLVLNLMPCVLPVLTIKAAGLVQTAHNPKESRAHGIAYGAGTLVCFLLLGGIIVGLRAAGEQVGGLGFQLQYAPVVATFALIMFAVGLNLMGLFEMGSSLMGVGGGLADQGGWKGAFFTGALAAFVGAPCVGPFMAGAIGVAFTQPPHVILLMFAVLGIGMALPFVALSFTPAVARLLPKPGKWMETFRQVLAFPMFLTAIWLLWVLGGQTGADGVLLVAVGGVALVFGIWLAKKIGGNLMGRMVAGLVILASLVGPVWASATVKAPVAGQTLAAEAGAEDWSTARVTALRAEGRPVFVDFTARWCVTCQVNKRAAIDTDAVRKAFAEHKVAFLVADWTNRNDEIAAELASHQRAGVPLYLMYPANGGPPVILPQVLTSGIIVQAVEQAG